jgi:hypothetical protein
MEGKVSNVVSRITNLQMRKWRIMTNLGVESVLWTAGKMQVPNVHQPVNLIDGIWVFVVTCQQKLRMLQKEIKPGRERWVLSGSGNFSAVHIASA